MKQTLRKTLSLLLAVTFIFGMTAAMHNFTKASAATITTYEIGDIIEFGWYPQSEVYNEVTISALNSADGKWKSYNYYCGTGEWADGKMTAGNYMRYKDVVYGQNKYRGVIFDSYRPTQTSNKPGMSSSQDNNGYNIKTVYWFKYEPIEWRVLNPNTGMVMAETILDSQAYNNYLIYGIEKIGVTTYNQYWGVNNKTYYANNYEKSSIRKWLNNDFYNTAFSDEQKNAIVKTKLDNTASDSKYDSNATTDKIYLLTNADVVNKKYGFSTTSSYYDPARQAQGSDYAKCQGLSVNSGNDGYYGNSEWILRKAKTSGQFIWSVESDGSTGGSTTDDTGSGIRPALNFSKTAEISQPDTYVTTTVPTTTTTTAVATKPATTKPVVTEPATVKPTQAPTTKPVVTEPATVKPTQAPTTKPVVTKPATTKPVVTEPATVKPTEAPTTKPVVTKPATTKPVVTESATVKPTEAPTTKPVVTKPATTKPVVTEPATVKPTEAPITKPVATKPATTKPIVTEPLTTKPVVTKPSTTIPGTIEEKFIKNPSTSTIKYGDTLILYADYTIIPADAIIEWSVEGNGVTIKPSADGKTCAVTSTSTGDVTITAKYTDVNGVEHVSKQEIESNASFWQKIVSFFKNLFGLNRIIEQVIKF
ncbi:MAG: hypothetical protein IKW12_05510 [Clostridia bacterium]|nr:hypothetical protein [Clostridia bacterium]